MTDSTKGAALFGKAGARKQEQEVTKNVTPPPQDVTPAGPPVELKLRPGNLELPPDLLAGLPPELAAALPKMLSGEPPDARSLQALGSMLGPMFGGGPLIQVDPLVQKQQERRELAKALLLSLAQGGQSVSADFAVRETTALLDGLDKMDAAERKEATQK